MIEIFESYKDDKWVTLCKSLKLFLYGAFNEFLSENTPPSVRKDAEDDNTPIVSQLPSSIARGTLDERLLEENVEENDKTDQACAGGEVIFQSNSKFEIKSECKLWLKLEKFVETKGKWTV